MDEAAAANILNHFPALKSLLTQWHAEAALALVERPTPGTHPDEALIEACTDLLVEQQCGVHFEAIDPADWDSFHGDAMRLLAQVQGIAATPALTRLGIRAKALALKALLDGGDGGELYEDASSPDRIAWSLVQDILTIQDITR